MTGWTKEAREASARARKAHAKSPSASTKRTKGVVESLVDRVKKQGATRKSFGEKFTDAARAGGLQSGSSYGNYADYLGRWGHMRANAKGQLSDQYWKRKGVDPAAARAAASKKKAR